MSAIKTTALNGRMRESARRFGVWTLAMLIGRAAFALTPLSAIRYAPDIAVVLGGTIVTPQNVAQDNLAGTVSLVNIGSIPNGTDVIAYSPLVNGDQLLAFDTTLSLPGGLIERPGDVVRFNGTTYSLAFDATANGLPNGVMTDAVAQISPNDLLLSFDVTVALGGIIAAPEDLVRFKNGSFSLFFDAAVAGVPAGLNLDAVDCLPRNGHLLLSFDGSGTVGGVTFDDEDVLEYTPGGNTWALAYDGSAQQAGWPPADLAAVSASAATPPNAVAPAIGGAATGSGSGGGVPGLPVGTARIFGTGTPEGKPSDSCIQIYLVGANGTPDSPPGSVDDELLGTGGTDAAGSFVDLSDMPGIPLSRPLGIGARIFASDVCEGLTGAVVAALVPAPVLSAAGLGVAVGLLLIVALIGLTRARWHAPL
jgi:hypothetical protein